jgi:serine/threonine-protein kinase
MTAAKLLVKIARTVQFAHENDILNRDIKPGNILVDKNGEPHLTDFGLARLIEQQSTVTNSFDVLGTPSYMSPEQAAGHTKELTAAADVYSLGAVFYQMLTGSRAFLPEEQPRQSYGVGKRATQSRTRNPKVDAELDHLLKCLESGATLPSAAAVADDIQRWLRRPIRRDAPGCSPVEGKWLQRNPTALAAALLAGLMPPSP